MIGKRLLCGWLVLVAMLRLLSVYLGYFEYQYLEDRLFTLAKGQVTPLYGRTFATWTLVTCCLCLMCSANIHNAAIYGATVFSFIAALIHFTTEFFLYETMSVKGVLSPGIIAGVSVVWMIIGWSKYVDQNRSKGSFKEE
eukprot:TRINITY_DN10347_c1_g1_i1.p3 TRINITY_DN10347_c1_g1~~TRINITY_DN10347_c1_g1_i1.p3  ORF type:complete len:140 (-),score=1.99 TRINITY_DN10347_c1_g1_i1:348-767(-)